MKCLSMGYKERDAKRALRTSNQDVESAVGFLVEEKEKRAQKQVMQLREACSHPYLFPGIEPEPFEEGEHLVQIIAGDKIGDLVAILNQGFNRYLEMYGLSLMDFDIAGKRRTNRISWLARRYVLTLSNTRDFVIL